MCRFILTGLKTLAGAVVFLPDVRLPWGQAWIIVLSQSKMARFRLRLPPPQPSPASQGREQFPGDVLDYEEGWTTSWLHDKRLSQRGVWIRGDTDASLSCNTPSTDF